MLTSRTNISAVRAKDLKCSETVFQYSSNLNIFILYFHVTAFQVRVIILKSIILISFLTLMELLVGVRIFSLERFVEMNP